MQLLRTKKGMSILEILLGLSISVIVITSLVSLSIFILRNAQSNKFRMQATRDANGTMERIRALRDTYSTNGSTWSDFVTLVNNGCTGSRVCVIDSALSVTSNAFATFQTNTIATSSVPVSYFRTSVVNANVIDITVTSSWYLGGSMQSTTIYSSLSNWSFL